MIKRIVSSNGKFVYTFPFEPPWEDLRMEGTASNGAKYYIFDSCVETDPVKRAEIDRRVANIFIQAERRRFMQKLAEEEAARAAEADSPENLEMGR